MKNQEYFYLSNGQAVGPLSFDEIVELIRVGTIHRGTFVLKKGESNWKTLSQLDVLYQSIKATLGSSHLPEAPASNESGNYFIGIPGEKIQGPFSSKYVTESLKNKKFGKSHFVFDSFINDWVPLFTHPDFDRRRLSRLNEVATPPTMIVPIPKHIRIKRLLRDGSVVIALLVGVIWIGATNKSLRCTTGSATHCQQLGYDQVKLEKYSDALVYFEKACKQNLNGACHDVGLIYTKLSDESKAQSYFKEACDKKYGPSCYQLSLKHPRNSEIAMGLISSGCEYDSAEACLELGQTDVLSNNQLRAQKFFNKACELKQAKGCNQLSIILSELKDKRGQAKALETSCQLGNGEGCAGLGQYYYDEGSMVLAEEYMLKACSSDNGNGCGGAANLAFLRADIQAGEKLAKRACELRDSIGCGLFASYLLDTKQIDSAIEYFKKACELKSGLSCFTLGNVLKTNRAPSSEINGAFEKACISNKKYCGKNK
ncbi:MAG: GYF domain-containing protein [Oligoflexia bacterium]|nr:GYF domain-containing protein [Oligoflexia bacterium]